MRKVLSSILKVGAAVSVLALATFDTGTIINPIKVKSPSGKEISFSDGEKVDVKNKDNSIYLVEKDGEEVSVNKSDLLLTKIHKDGSRVIRITPLLKEKDTKMTLRYLLEDEVLNILKNEGEYLKVKIENEEGYVLSNDVANADEEKVYAANLTEDYKNDENFYPVNSPFIVKNYENGMFLCMDSSGKEVSIPKEIIKFKEGTVNRGDDLRNYVFENNVVSIAKMYLGRPYVYGANGPNSFDCSGFSSFVYKQLGIKLPRSSASQSNFGQFVERDNLIPGDLIFFNTTGRGVSHVGIYIGNGEFIHSATTQKSGVVIDDLNSAYYSRTYVSARRVK